MFLDIAPGGRKRQRVTRKQVQKIKKGGEIGDQIREMREHHHENHEVPKAEKHMDEALENWPENLPHEKGGLEGGSGTKKQTLWQKIKLFLS